MKIKNRDIVDIYRCLQEIIDNKDGKQKIPDSGRVTYNNVKNLNIVQPIFKDLFDKEKNLNEGAALALEADKEKEKEIQKQLDKDLIDLFDDQFQEVEFHKMSVEVFEIMQKYISGKATVTMLNFLVKE